MTSTVKKYFFKVFVPEKHYERMLIPNAFVKSARLQGRIPGDVILRNDSRRAWFVKTRLIEGQFYFVDGWKDFQEENCLGKADFLVFKYDWNNGFKVIILEQSTECEKTVVMLEEEDSIEEKGTAESEMTKGEEHEEVEEEDYDDHHNDSDDEYAEMEEESVEVYSAESMRSQSHRRACKRESATSSTPTTEDPQLQHYEFDPEMYIQPGNPFFEAKLHKQRPNIMVFVPTFYFLNLLSALIPGKVMKDLSLTFPEKITLLRCQCFQRRDFQSNELRDYLEVANVSKWQDGRVCVTGWGSFCRRNKIKENNVCICEIVSGEDQIIRTFRVHVLGARNE